VLKKTIILTILTGTIYSIAEEKQSNFKRPNLPLKPAHTFSIVAHDPDTGEFGAAVQSHWFSVGADVIWAAPGIGAVATQSFIEVSYGPNGLKMMREGNSAPETLNHLISKDKHKNVRQVGMIDAKGRVANYTGSNAIDAHCDLLGTNYSVQANLMEKDTVCNAMSKAFESTQSDLAGKLMASLEAAQNEGGDIRGRQSAALLIVSGDKNTPIWKGREFDLRVEDHVTPIQELKRLLHVARGYKKMTDGDDFMTEGKVEEALSAYSEAEKMMPNNHEAIFWHAATLAAIERVDESLPLFRKAFAMHPLWRELIPRLPKSGLLPDDKALIDKILSVNK